MKKAFALLLALCLVLSLAACGGQSKTAAGTWKSKLDLKDLVSDKLDDILDRLEKTDMEVTLVLHEDKTFLLTMDGTGVAAAVQEAATAYFTGLLDSLGLSQEQYEQISGKSLETMIEEAVGKIDQEVLSRDVTGTYTEEKGSLVLKAKGLSARGSWEGDVLTLTVAGIGKMTFTRG